MEADERVYRLLEEIRDVQREHLAEYRRVTGRLLDLQQAGAAGQARARQAYKRIAGLGGVLVAVLLVLLGYLLVKWGPYLFR